ncbi:MAG: hypothetical protein U1E45_11020 [Geminicoccaceae bacterium]
MRSTALTLMALLLAACTTPAPNETGEMAAERRGGDVVAVIGTPFYMLFKGVTCVATVAVAAPSSALLGVTTRRNRYEEQSTLQYGIGHNCGGDWTLNPTPPTPYAAYDSTH